MFKHVILSVSVVIVSSVLTYSTLAATTGIEASAIPPQIRNVIADETAEKYNIQSSAPTQLRVPSLDITIPIRDGVYEDASKTWTLEDGVMYYLATTPEPNDTAGNSFFYGHNSPSVFMPLLEIAPGEEIYIDTVSGDAFVYTFERYEDVSPRNVAYVTGSSSRPTITMQTCVGENSEIRRMFQFSFTRVE